MIKKSSLVLSIAAAMFFSGQASACAISAWDPVSATGSVGVLAADAVNPTSGSGNSRYSNQCGLRLVGAAPKYVQNTIATAATTYKARFYARKSVAGDSVEVFRALTPGDATVISVTFTGTAFNFSVGGASAGAITVASGTAWYGVEIDWAQAATGGFTAKVTGGGGVVGTPALLTANTTGTLTIGKARLGSVSGTVTGNVFVDEFDSRRTTAPGLLRRGDSNGSNTATAADAIQALNEAAGGAFAVGQPDCNENGSVTAADAVCALNLAAAL